MSIIYDALKKVEENHPQHLPEPMAKKSKSIFSVKKILIGFIVLVLLFLVTKSLYVRNTAGARIPASAITPEKTLLLLPPAPEKIKEKKAPGTIQDMGDNLTEKFVLNGVFFTDNQGYALINNRITKEGDSVNDAIVKKITLEEVEIDYQGTIHKLPAS